MSVPELVPENEEVGYRRQFRHFSTQVASAMARISVDQGQWVGRLFRVYGTFSVIKPGNLESTGLTTFGGEERARELAREARAEAIADSHEVPEGEITREEMDRAAADETQRFHDFLAREQISDLAISNVTYEIDPNDADGLHYIAKGFIDIKESAGQVLAAGMRYSFQHRIKATYHTRDTVFTEIGPIPETTEPGSEEPVLA